MKIRFLIIAVFCFKFSSPAEPFRLEGEPFRPVTNCTIVWDVPSNPLPRGLWVYKVVPQAFSAAVVSNAMALGHFQMNNLSKTGNRLPDEYLIHFQNKNEFNRSRELFIAPSLGVMKYQSERDYRAPITNVPSSEETETLARDVLFQLGIDRSLLGDRVRNGYDETSTSYDRSGHELSPERVVLRGISFERRVDGVPLSDNSCFLIHFRSRGEIEDFSLHWRNILPHESHRVFNSAEIIEMINSGESVLPEQFYDLTGLDSANKLMVTKVTLRYYNGHPDEPLDFMFPYADLEMVAERGSTNRLTFHLHCPILGEKTP